MEESCCALLKFLSFPLVMVMKSPACICILLVDVCIAMNFTSIPTDAMMCIIQYLSPNQQYNLQFLHSKLHSAVSSVHQDEIKQVKHLCCAIRCAIKCDDAFHEYEECIILLTSELTNGQSNLFIDALYPILSMISVSSNISDVNKITLLNHLHVYSRNPQYFAPEHFLDHKYLDYSVNTMLFSQLPQRDRILIIVSRIITQFMYPFTTEIESIRHYIHDTFTAKGSPRLIYNARQFPKNMFFGCMLYRTSVIPSIPVLYKRMSRMDPLIYFAVLYFEELIAKRAYDSNGSVDRSLDPQMRVYYFIKWNPVTIRRIKKEYFKAWKSDMTIQQRHQFDIYTYHQHYGPYFNLAMTVDLETRLNGLRIKVAAIALMETFDACLSDKECNFRDHEYLTKDMLLTHGLDCFIRGEIEICEKLINIFARICNKNDLLWIIESQIPYLYSVSYLLNGRFSPQNYKHIANFKVFCVCHLFKFRKDWVMWKLKLKVMFCKIDYVIVRQLRAHKII